MSKLFRSWLPVIVWLLIITTGLWFSASGKAMLGDLLSLILGINVNLISGSSAEKLNDIAKIKGLELIDFMSSNPWDFSPELITVIGKNPNITRSLHIAVQSGNIMTFPGQMRPRSGLSKIN